MQKNKYSNYSALILVFPFVFFYCLFLLYPTVYTILFSFTNSPLIGWGDWVGFENYIKLFKDKLFAKSLKNTFVFVFWTVVPNTLLGLFCAMMISRIKNYYLSGILLACFFLPHILPVTVVTEIWSWMLSKQFGVIQEFLEIFGFKKIGFFSQKTWAMPMVALITIWWTVGFNILLFIAGLKAINPEIYEASDLDGANRWDKFRYITWPLIWPITALVLTLQLIFQLKIFDQMYLLTSGGPFNSTLVVLQLVYKQGFQMNRGGYASAIAMVLFIIIIMASIIQYYVLRTRDQDK
tara:strand:+ start:373 stop:1254 length:882 start_codon:yes stop_codon:yes gene_type:complete